VKQKNNIFEELNKMKNLIHAKAGVVISEQANVGTDVGTVMRELGATFNADEDIVVNTIKKYKDKASFKSFVDQYKAITGKDFGSQLILSISPYNDKKEWNDLKTHLASLGVTLGDTTTNRGNSSTATFGGLDTPAAPAAPATGRTPETIKSINATFCNVRGGKISSGFFQGQPWSNYKTKYSVTAAEEAEAQKSCPTVKTGIVSGSGNKNNKSNNYTRIVGDTSKKIQSTLGMSPTGQLSNDDIQKIIGLLNGEVSGEVNQSTNNLPKTPTGQIDVEKMIELLK
jgi:hypothetical protein